MRASGHLQFALEVHPPCWSFPAGKSWIAGWIQPGTGHVITDLRARLNHRVLLGLFGLPHPAFAKDSAQPTDCGFSFFFAPHPGANLLRLEARDAQGRWTEFFRTKISATSNADTSPPAPQLSESLVPLLSTLIKHHMRHPRHAWRDLADDVVTEFIAEPLDSHPNAPFVGELEEPREFCRIEHGRISATGWLAHSTHRISRLLGVIEPLPAAILRHGLARPDLDQVFPEKIDRGSGAFVGAIPLPAELAAPVLLKIFSELDNGEKQLVFGRRFTSRFGGTFTELPPMVPARILFRAGWELLRAAKRHALREAGVLQHIGGLVAAYRSMPVYRSAENYSHPPAPHADSAPPRPDTAGLSSFKDDYRPGIVGRLPDCVVIAPADDMCVPDASHYFQIGREALELVQHAATRAGVGPVTAILDLPSGYGRVTRWLRTAYPAARLTVSDTQPDGIAFCVEHLGATGVLAAVDGRHWVSLPGPYDIIWCGSLLTHFDAAEWRRHLQKFAERLSSNGVLVFTSHGLPVLDRMQSGEKNYGLAAGEIGQLCHDTTTQGFGYTAYAETPGYGISIAQPGWIRAMIAGETDLEVLEIAVAAWGRHQDVIVCRRRSH